jgi:hypothetical protein
MNIEQTGIHPSWNRLCVCVDHLFPYHMTGVWERADPPPHLSQQAWLSSEPCFISTQNSCHMNFFWSTWMVLINHHHFHRHQLTLHKNPTRDRVSKPFFSGCHLSIIFRILGCLELFSNSHLSILIECGSLVGLRFHGRASHLAIVESIWSECS